jgi:hypothetical protein
MWGRTLPEAPIGISGQAISEEDADISCVAEWPGLPEEIRTVFRF